MSSLNAFDGFFVTFFAGLPGGLMPFFTLVTELGEPLVLVALSAIGLVLSKGNLRALAAVLLIGLFVGNLTMYDLKLVVDRQRPDDARISDPAFGPSFPSGHALLAFLAASIIGGYMGWKYRLAAYLVAALIAISRLYLGVHYATDVLAGAAIGIAIGEIAVCFAFRLGICASAGLAGLLPLPSLKGSHRIAADGGKPSTQAADAIFYIVIASALVLSTYALDNWLLLESLALALAAPALVILTAGLKMWRSHRGLLASVLIISSGYGLAFLLFYYQSYRLSLLFLALMIVAMIGLTLRERRPAGTI